MNQQNNQDTILWNKELINEELTPFIEKRQWKKIKEFLNQFKTETNFDGTSFCEATIDETYFLNSDYEDSGLNKAVYLSFHELAGLVNANQSVFFNETSLQYNSLHFKHKDFFKNYNDLSEQIDSNSIQAILLVNSQSKNSTYKKEIFSFIMEDYLEKYGLQIDDFVMLHLFKDIDYFKYAIDMDIFSPQRTVSTKQTQIQSSLLQKAVSIGSIEVIEYLLKNYEWNLKEKRADGTHLFFSAITNEHNSKIEKVVDLLFSYIHEYDFNTLYYPSQDAEKHYISSPLTPDDKGYTIKQFLDKEKEDIRQSSTFFSDYKEFYINRIDKIIYTIEKHQIEQSMNSFSEKNKNKQKI